MIKAFIFSIVTALAVALTVQAVPAYAHGPNSSHHSVDGERAAEVASNKVRELVDTGKLDDTWLEATKRPTVEKKEFEKGPEWVITYVNGSESDPSKKTLYVFISMTGRYIAANFTGN